MGYVLLAIEVLVACWLFCALLGVWSGRSRSKVSQAVAMIVSVLLLLGAIALPYAIHVVSKTLKVHQDILQTAMILAIVALLGGIVTWVLGRRAGWRWKVERLQGEPALASDPGIWSPMRLGLALAVVCLLLMSTYGGLLDAVAQQRIAVRAEADAIIASMTPPPVKESENAAPYYMRLGEYYDNVKFPEIWYKAGNELYRWKEPAIDAEHEADDAETVPFDFTNQELVDFLQSQQGTRELILQATRFPECRFERDYSRPSYLDNLPVLGSIEQCSYSLAVDGRYRVATGDLSGALENVRAMRQLARHTLSNRYVVCSLYSARMESRADLLLEFALASGLATAEDLNDIDTTPRSTLSETLSQAVISEEALMLRMISEPDACERVNSWGGDMLAKERVLWPFYDVFFFPSDLAGFREVSQTSRFAEAEEDSFSKAIVRKTKFEERMMDGRTLGLLTRRLFPAVPSGLRITAVSDTQRRLADTGVAMYRYQLDHGEFPDSLEQLVPEYLDLPPLDPIDGKLLRMVKTPEAVLLYSVGVDGVDDGGVVKQDVSREGDITFKCILPTAGDEATPEAASESE